MSSVIAVVTSSRADWGHLLWPLRRMSAHRELDPRLIVTGAHLDGRFGRTIDVITGDGFEPAAVVECLDIADSRSGMARTIGRAVTGLSDVLEEMSPDMLLLVADRYEMLAPACVATAMGIPIAHMEGGEISLGAVDQHVRDALTQMSVLHLAPTEAAAARLTSIGAKESAIVVTGAPSLDHLRWSVLPELSEVERQVGIDLQRRPIVVSMHPTTMHVCSTDELSPLMAALHGVGRPVVFCFPNADVGYEQIIASARTFCGGRDDARVVTHLDHLSYWTLLKHSGVLVGNSSSGIMEAPSILLPVVNVGDRQRGRTRSPNIIDVAADESAIAGAITTAMTDAFRTSIARMVTPYGDGDAGTRIAEAIASWSRTRKLSLV